MFHEKKTLRDLHLHPLTSLQSFCNQRIYYCKIITLLFSFKFFYYSKKVYLSLRLSLDPTLRFHEKKTLRDLHPHFVDLHPSVIVINRR